jgi:hypothetical protein
MGIARFHAAIGMTIMLLVRSSRPCSTILSQPCRQRPPSTHRHSDAHDEADGEDEAAEELDEPWVRPGAPPETTSESRPPKERKTPARTALKRTRSSRVRCLATPCATIADATCAGVSVLESIVCILRGVVVVPVMVVRARRRVFMVCSLYSPSNKPPIHFRLPSHGAGVHGVPRA